MVSSLLRVCLSLSATSTLLACSYASSSTSDTAGDATSSVAAGASVETVLSSDELVNSIGMKLVRISKGEFAMGSARGNPSSDGDERQHAVTITRDYFLGAFEVTQSQYERVMGRNPSLVKADGENRPVDRVSWNDAVAFCERLSQLPEEKAAGRSYRLPSEAEWEYACRAGSPDEYAFGNDTRLLGEYAWYSGNSGIDSHPVGQKKPNAWGLYDMHGNAWEWCADWYERYSGRPAIDPTGPSDGTDRVYRGGSVGYSATYSRSANRTATSPSWKGFVSFRVAMDAPTQR